MGFNSKLVRLKGENVLTVADVGRFQFQTGSIKRAYLPSYWQALSCFNSKLVRLKVEDIVSGVNQTRVFQFQTGSIKSDRADFFDELLFDSFNSKLVRLKARVYFFSFLVKQVSIPNWFD